MPHTQKPPETTAEILATATPDPEWTTTKEENPMPTGKDWGTDPAVLKRMSEAMLPRLRATLDASRPEAISERDVYIDIQSTSLKPDGGQIRVLVCQPATFTEGTSSPIVILYHGGGHTVGNPESEIPLARLLVQRYHAVVVLPAYRLAPEHKFPTSFNDGLEVLKIVAGDIVTLKQQQQRADYSTQPNLQILDPQTQPSSTLVVGGTSAGSTITTSVNHLYHKYRNISKSPTKLPPVTSLFLSCGSCINPTNVYHRYAPFLHSREQNMNEPPLDKDMTALFKHATQMDYNNPIWSSFDQRPDLAGKRDSVAEDHIWMAGVTNQGDTAGIDGVKIEQPPMRVYFQVCGADVARDDSLIYERVLREECAVETRLDLYEGFGHVFWGLGGVYPEMEMSKKRMKHTVEGIGWCIGSGK